MWLKEKVSTYWKLKYRVMLKLALIYYFGREKIYKNNNSECKKSQDSIFLSKIVLTSR